jgi:Thiopeptide-type bacteriocin precursor
MLHENVALSISLDDIDLSDIESFDVEVLNSADSIAIPEGAASFSWYTCSCSCSCPHVPEIEG